MQVEDSYEGAVARLQRMEQAGLIVPTPEQRMRDLEELATLASEENERLQQLLDALGEQAPRLGRIAHVGSRHPRLQLVEEIDRRIGAGVGLQERDLEVFVELVADLGADERAGDGAAGALQAALQLSHPARAIGGGWLGLGGSRRDV
jgi:hypothetical protein